MSCKIQKNIQKSKKRLDFFDKKNGIFKCENAIFL